jgi:hypothetical protein
MAPRDSNLSRPASLMLEAFNTPRIVLFARVGDIDGSLGPQARLVSNRSLGTGDQWGHFIKFFD